MSDLIERVARAICFANWDGAVSAEAAEAEREYSHDLWVDEARAAIAAVAEWLDGIGKHTAAAELRAGSIMEAAQ
jgi:hypothetical protein